MRLENSSIRVIVEEGSFAYINTPPIKDIWGFELPTKKAHYLQFRHYDNITDTILFDTLLDTPEE